MTTPTRTYLSLEQLHEELTELRRLLGDEAVVPEAHSMTAHGLLAEADWTMLSNAASVVHRLFLWTRYADVSPESYLELHAWQEKRGELRLVPGELDPRD